jgi:hypothetical protein
MGRPRRYPTPEECEKTRAVLAAGGYRTEAALAAGVPYSVFKEWLTRAREGEEAYVTFAASVQKGEASAAPALLAIIRKASRKQWTAAAWILERRWPQRWGRIERQQREMTVRERVSLELPPSMSPEEAREVLEVLLRHETDERKKAEYQAALAAMQGA